MPGSARRRPAAAGSVVAQALERLSAQESAPYAATHALPGVRRRDPRAAPAAHLRDARAVDGHRVRHGARRDGPVRLRAVQAPQGASAPRATPASSARCATAARSPRWCSPRPAARRCAGTWPSCSGWPGSSAATGAGPSPRYPLTRRPCRSGASARPRPSERRSRTVQRSTRLTPSAPATVRSPATFESAGAASTHAGSLLLHHRASSSTGLVHRPGMARSGRRAGRRGSRA